MALFKKIVILVLLVSLALTLSGCGGECKADSECEKEHFTGTCADKKCEFKPIPGVCGNSVCEKEKYNENECVCPQDCGDCKGSSGKNMIKNCVQDKCAEDLPAEKQKPVLFTADETNAGDKIRAVTEFTSPFNVKRDLIKFTFFLSQKNNFNHVIKNIELTGVSLEKRTVVLGQKSTRRAVWDLGKEYEVQEEIVVDFPTKEKEGEFKDLVLAVTIDYDIKSAGKFYTKSAVIKIKYKDLKFVWAKPDAEYPCPACEQREGFQAVCGAQTNFLCNYQPVAGKCGNNICDSNENKCICAKDCGPCKGETNFLEAGCAQNNCVYTLKSSAVQEPVNRFDARQIDAGMLANNYKYSKPFSIKKDKFSVSFSVVDLKQDVTKLRIESVRLMEGNEQIAVAEPKQELGKTKPLNVEISIPLLAAKEEEKILSLRIDYSYVKGGNEERRFYVYNLEKISVLNPDA